MFKRILLIGLMFLGCNNNPVNSDNTEFLEIDARLNQDSNGYYHLTLDRYNNQTIHRISANTGHSSVYNNGRHDPTMPKVGWGAYDENGNVATWILIQFGREHQVNVINHSSYPDTDGIVNTDFGPAISMVGDTIRVIAVYDSLIDGTRYIDEVYIILD